MTHKPTDTQIEALYFIENNPQSTFTEIAEGAGTRSANSVENSAIFVMRLVNNGWAQVTLTNEGRDAAGMNW